jgi:hypothetical protein
VAFGSLADKKACQVGSLINIHTVARHWWLTPVILATQEAEIRRIVVQSQPRKIVLRDPILKKPITKKGWGLVEWLKA